MLCAKFGLKFLNFVNVLSLFRYYLPWKRVSHSLEKSLVEIGSRGEDENVKSLRQQ